MIFSDVHKVYLLFVKQVETCLIIDLINVCGYLNVYLKSHFFILV